MRPLPILTTALVAALLSGCSTVKDPKPAAAPAAPTADACTLVGTKGRTCVTREGRDYAAWSVAVHDLAPEASLALQRSGLGTLHDMGCGILAPHKTITTSD